MKYLLITVLIYSCRPCPKNIPIPPPVHYGWFKCVQTGKVCILAPDGAILYSYYEPAKRKPIQDWQTITLNN